MKKSLVLIGGLDPTGHAGILADARVLEEMGLPYFTVVTALTAQTDKNFFGWEGCSSGFFRRQLQSCGKNIAGVKIGMIGNTGLIGPLVAWLDRVKPRHVIWDPVFQSSSGGKLISAKEWNRDLEKLLRRVTVWTPNIPEAQWILDRPIHNIMDMESAISDLHAHFPVASPLRGAAQRWILLKGGHLPQKQKRVVDLLSDGKKIRRFSGKRLKKNPRGTGCTLASALLAYLAQGKPPTDAVRLARRLLFSTKFKTSPVPRSEPL
jgi:hydroxymethylpyrimidine/phosphomethylpyrimidine kinase